MNSDVADLLFSLSHIQPELALAAFALVGGLIGAAFGDRAAGFLCGLAILVFLGCGAYCVVYQPGAPVPVFGGALIHDGFSAYVKAVLAFSAAATLALGVGQFGAGSDRRFEFPLIVSLALLGLFVMASANDLIALYIGLELQSLASYVLAAFRRDDAKSSEAGLKYFVLSALSSGLLLYGASLIYGFTGSVGFAAIGAAASAGGVGLTFGLVFLLCGIAFKMSAAPFHMWTPDVYEGAPTPVAALFAAAPKLAAVALMARVLYGPFADLEPQWTQVIVALSGLSLLVGSFAALVQTNIKRLMAYSSIANIGFVLMALAAGPEEGASAALIYMTLYLPATIGVFAVIVAMRREGAAVERIEDLAGLATRRPWMAVALTMLFFSLAGIPPLAGFFGKIYVFKAAIAAGLWPLSVIGALCTVVGAGYYLRIVKIAWFDAPAAGFDRTGPTLAGTAVLGAALSFPALVVLLGQIEFWAARVAASSF